MKRNIISLNISGIILLLLIAISCSDEPAASPPTAPQITTTEVTPIDYATAIGGGRVNNDGTVVTGRGVCWSTGTTPTVADNKTTDGAGKGSFTSTITGLTENTTYYVRAYATYSEGTEYGSAKSFTTPIMPPLQVTTIEVSSISFTTAASGGHVTSNGGTLVTGKGVCWSTGTTPTIADNKTTDGEGANSFASAITGLTENTKYYVRAYATYSEGIQYGNVVSFKTPTGETVSDIDGNMYHIVTIGTQQWMVENLRVTKYNDGTDIPLVTDNTTWSTFTTDAFCWFNNDAPGYKDPYGALYNWYAVGTDKLCPSGWDVPTDAEWATLLTHLGGEGNAGHKLKESGTLHWVSSNTITTNESGFTALPGGTRYSAGTFYATIGEVGFWWSSSEDPATNAWFRFLFHEDGSVGRGSVSKEVGMSVRCIKD